jgi:hypothetical protein
MPTIDLHGYRKSEAIRALTDFLEDVVTSSSRQHFPSGRRRRQQQLQQQEQQQQYDDDDDGDIRPKTMNTRNFKQYGDDFIWCLVITGTGAHSPEGRKLLHRHVREFSNVLPEVFVAHGEVHFNMSSGSK